MLTKKSDAGNQEMYLRDNFDIVLHHTGQVGGAAAQETEIVSGQKLSGWFMFPRPPEGSYEFRFYDDDLGLVVDGIRLIK